MGWREMSAGCLPAYAFGGYIAACAKVMTVRKVGHGLFVCTRIVWGSTISTDSIGLKFDEARIFGSFTRSMLNFADSALNSSPLVNLTPLRSLTSHVVGATSFGISVASPGMILRFGSRSHNVSKRSEEHTSELQSPCNLVCRLLLEKKHRYPLQSSF